MAFLPDGKRGLTGSRDATIKVWDVESGALLRSFEGHTANIVGLAVDPGGRRFASAGWDPAVKVWDLPPAGR